MEAEGDRASFSPDAFKRPDPDELIELVGAPCLLFSEAQVLVSSGADETQISRSLRFVCCAVNYAAFVWCALALVRVSFGGALVAILSRHSSELLQVGTS